MAGFRSLFRPLNRQVRQHVVDVTTPRLDDLSGQIEDVRLATVEVRRLVTDDLDASNEVAALVGKALADLTAAVDELRDEVAALKSRLG
jgi:ubiquinone biosynthesis protein UbiJ